MNSLKPLAIFPWPMDESTSARVQEAFIANGFDFDVQPCEAVPGGHVRVLALGGVAPFLCDCAPVGDPTSVTSIRNALRYVLDERVDVNEGFTVNDYLEQIFGALMNELEPERHGPVFE